ncbi:MAG: hypothetical protein FJ137_08595 [Deltaproteobacteria bacterium]|nr:hypothetical protein [Deltaproteobacteria bacterium]
MIRAAAAFALAVLVATSAAHARLRPATAPATARPVVVAPPAPPPPPPLPRPTEADLAAFRNVVEDADVLRIPPCRRAGRATTDCRDPMSYLTSNERLQRVWRPFVENRGGAFVGVGADQAYAFVAAARSEWVWLIDYDPQVVRLHHLVQALVREAETPDAFVAFFARGQEALTRARLARLLADRTDGVDIVVLFSLARVKLHAHYRRQLIDDGDFGWLNDAERYRFVRTLVQQGRVHAVAGNLLTDKALPSIGAAARALSVPVRVYYPSNAEEMWRFTPQYRVNVLGLPFDEHSVVLRTLFNKRRPWDDVGAYWHYVVHKGTDAQRMLGDERWLSSRALMAERHPTPEPVLSALGFSPSPSLSAGAPLAGR